MEMNDMVIISVDDHITEPPDMFDKHLSKEDLATAPKFGTDENGKNYWTYQGMYMPSVGLNAVVGRPMEEYGMEPNSLEEMRKGVYNVDARVDDMNANGIAASLNFGTVVGFDGGRFHKAPDKAMALKHLRAYNDWHIDEWCGAHPGRFIACGILPTWDMDATVAEIKRIAAKGCTAVSLNENPTTTGLPSIHNAYWEPMWKAITDADITICLHIGAGNPAPHASPETPIEAWITTMPMSVAVGAADWLNLSALERYPSMKICLSESGIGWIPYFMERADFSHERHKAWTYSSFQGKKPSDIFKKHFMSCFIDDAFGLDNLKYLNEDMVAYECDYPHSDTLWPEVPEFLWKTVKGLTTEQIEKITHRNAMNFYNFDLFKFNKREDLTVGALRAKAKADGVDTTPKSSGGASPLAEGEAPRRIVSGDLMKMFAHHAKEGAKKTG
ncbi:amidohydrolase family protein [Pseudomaricurvus sp. HS19]|uniref:amidohydrolase family protein n=1 Tax=Pseudomaricurvus sp. HS19 TaxID=2692626 RepID=UPI001368C546|nr:amidohydrolase family protein [Pseudomaricurvus sp. HS19]MYM64043.1 amidohydrolase family protein [Pseudomaricurvus sp. HS19]